MAIVECQVQLPAEILKLIFQLLPAWDLRVVVQVCSFWREVGEAPGLWAHRTVCLARGDMSSLPEVLGARRMLLVKRLRLLEWGDIPEETVRVVVEHPGLRLLELRGVSLSVEPDLLARAVAGLEKVELRSSQLTTEQTQAVLRAAGSSRQLKKLDMAMNKSIPGVSPELLASAVLNLEEFSIGYSVLTSQQIEAIFSTISGANSLKVLRIGYNRLSKCPDERVQWLRNIEKMINVLSQIKRKSFLADVDITVLDATFYMGYYQISTNKEWYKIVRID